MTYVVKLYVGGKVFEEEVQAVNPQDARETALARNPKAKVMGVNVRFWWNYYFTKHPQIITMSAQISKRMYLPFGLLMIPILIIVGALVSSQSGDSTTPKPNNSTPQRTAKHWVA